MKSHRQRNLSVAFLLSYLPFAFVFPVALMAQTENRSDSVVVDFLESKHHIRFTDNNSIVPLENGGKKFADLFKAILSARKSIHLEYFNFRNDSISSELFTLLAQKAKEGVEVRALFDGFGNASNNRPLKARHLRALREHGIEIYEFDPMRFPWINHALSRDHRKIVVIDGMIAYTGGMNVADYYIKGKPEFGSWHDFHLRVEGDAVGALQAIFLRMWNRTTGQNIHGPQYYPGEKDAALLFPDLPTDTTATAGRKKIGVVNREPHSSPKVVRETFLAAINAAQHQIQIINPYLTLNRKLSRALKRAVRRGVNVEILISEKSDIPITPRIVEYNANRLMKSGVKIYVYQKGFHHTKIMTVDSRFSFVGSANLNSRSLSWDYECNLLVADTCFTGQVEQLFEREKTTGCYLLTPEVRRQMSKMRRFQGWLFHFLQPFVLQKVEKGYFLNIHTVPLLMTNDYA